MLPVGDNTFTYSGDANFLSSRATLIVRVLLSILVLDTIS